MFLKNNLVLSTPPELESAQTQAKGAYPDKRYKQINTQKETEINKKKLIIYHMS